MQCDLITGDWLLGEDYETNGYERVYEGIVVDGWSGGVEWIASRPVVDQIVADQTRLYRHDPVDPQGNYAIGFGWTWGVVQPR